MIIRKAYFSIGVELVIMVTLGGLIEDTPWYGPIAAVNCSSLHRPGYGPTRDKGAAWRVYGECVRK